MRDCAQARVDVLSYGASAVKMRSYGTYNTDDNHAMSGYSSTASGTSPASGGNSKQANHGVTAGDIAVGVVIGRSSEYFDFFVFGIASALVFPPLFFPFLPHLEATLWSFLIFSLAFIARPIGTITSMFVQERFSVSVKLTLALFTLGTSTAGIAFLPTYESIGPAAIVLLALFRFGQGLGMGGSWDGLPSLLNLIAPKERRGWYAMLGQLGAPLGFAIASGLFAYLYTNLSKDDFLDFGWRYPFFVAFAMNVVALFARLRMVVSPEFQELMAQRELQPADTSALIRDHWSDILVASFARLASYALFHLVTIFPISWVILHTLQPVETFLRTQFFGAGLAAIAMVISGFIADRIGRRRTLAFLAIGIAVFSGFTPMLLGGGTVGQNVFILVGFILLGLSYGQSSGTITAKLTGRERYTGAALTADLAWLIGAAFAPLVALGLSTVFGLGAVSVYLLSGAACSLIALQISRQQEPNRT